MTDFPGFFKALWTSEKWQNPEPFPWQTMLAERAASGDWPKVIHLPTASGKTACLDAAIFGLAATAIQPLEKRLPRRIWFVVDRRIVVDEAFNRAKDIARRLVNPADGPLREVADVLRELAGTGRPLATARLRGGTWKSDDWARLPCQPTIICSTVDQIGSALLFRAYGHSDETASIYAGLAAHDSLILLDEAHCAAPFMQTLSAIERFRGEPWAERPLKTAFRYCMMSATLPEGIAEAAMFPRPAQRTAALAHPRLQLRLTAQKLATLARPVKDGQFVAEAAKHAEEYVKTNQRVAVMVNRVATAQAIAEQLRERLREIADVVLLTGRMRPLDRDVLVKRWEGRLKAGTTEALEKPIVVVTTQCLEVGADFSFAALVTECASLDALRQRFGRLDRLGELRKSSAVILIRERDTKNPKDEGDPIYGKAINETWKWLDEVQDEGSIDFGAAAMDLRAAELRKADEHRFRTLLAPALDAPVLLPAHLDLLCQTSPRPNPEPDVSLFLHGKNRSVPEVRVVFRTDLIPEGDDAWIETLSVLPPTHPEMLSVPLHRLKRWLKHETAADADGDVEGAREDETAEGRVPQPAAGATFVIWRGRDRSVVTSDFGQLRPNDIIVLPLSKQALSSLGQSIDEPEGLGAGWLDLAERATWEARGRAVLRIRPDVLGPWCERSSVSDLVEIAKSEPEKEEIKTALEAVLVEPIEKWLEEIVRNLCDGDFRIEDHPAGGLILVGERTGRPGADEESEDDPFADAEDLASESSEPVSLPQHIAGVWKQAEEFATRCLHDDHTGAITAAAQAHDLGKLDWRFQLMLRNADEVAALDPPLAKSAVLPRRHRKRRQITEDAHLPRGFRHEFLSMQLAQYFGLAPADDEDNELALHLIASHHGYARPFAPVVPDELVAEGRAGDLCLSGIGIDTVLTAVERQSLTPADRLDSGVPERFWRLTRRYGWWGLAYLESILRLADWKASRRPAEASDDAPGAPGVATRAHSAPHKSIALDALDGANPLAFLAALGTLRVLTRVVQGCDLRLSWEQRFGAWRPVLWAAEPPDEATIAKALVKNSLNLSAMFSEELLAASEAASPKNKKGEARWKDKLLFPIEDFRQFCRSVREPASVCAEFAATWAGETVSVGEDDEAVARRTRFDFTAGQQAFVSMLRELRESCTREDVEQALFVGWRYSAAAVSMRWDTQDEKRQYALQSVDPTNNSKNPPTAVRGANFLAVEALPLFPLVPDRRAAQPGFDGDRDGRYWSWPIWTYPANLDVIRSLLTLPLADWSDWPVAKRRALGVSAVFQSRIVQPSGRYRCFTPARGL